MCMWTRTIVDTICTGAIGCRQGSGGEKRSGGEKCLRKANLLPAVFYAVQIHGPHLQRFGAGIPYCLQCFSDGLKSALLIYRREKSIGKHSFHRHAITLRPSKSFLTFLKTLSIRSTQRHTPPLLKFCRLWHRLPSALMI
jgi:hypothetical protein